MACKIFFNDLIREYNKMKSQLQQIVDLKNIDALKEFSIRISEFLSLTKKRFEQLNQRYQDIHSTFKKFTSCLAEDPTSISPDKFFECFKMFTVIVEMTIIHQN